MSRGIDLLHTCLLGFILGTLVGVSLSLAKVKEDIKVVSEQCQKIEALLKVQPAISPVVAPEKETKP